MEKFKESKELERLRSLQESINIFLTVSVIGKVEELRDSNYPQDLVEEWIKFLEAKKSLNEKLKKYNIGEIS